MTVRQKKKNIEKTKNKAKKKVNKEKWKKEQQKKVECRRNLKKNRLRFAFRNSFARI